MNSKIDFNKIYSDIKNLGIFDCVKVLDVVDSTNNYLKDRFSSYDKAIVVAKRQSAGRGRLGRSWSSDFGGCLMFSMLIKPDISDEKLAFLTQLVAVVLHKTIKKYIPNHANLKIKWPNDILLNAKKISGILTERIVISGERNSVIIGIGSNLYDEIRDDELIDIAGTIESEIGITIPAVDFMVNFILDFFISFDNFCDNSGIDSGIIAYINDNFYLSGKTVTVDGITGLCNGVDKEGCIVIGNYHIRSGIVEEV